RVRATSTRRTRRSVRRGGSSSLLAISQRRGVPCGLGCGRGVKVQTEQLIASQRGQRIRLAVVIDELHFEFLGRIPLHNCADAAAQKPVGRCINRERNWIEFVKRSRHDDDYTG